jgi:hypothetical protein
MPKVYIEKEAAITAIGKPKVTPGGVIFDALKKACQEEVRSLPAADVVEVVRCRECRFLERGSQFDLSGEGHETASFCSVVGFTPDDDWYCADGERKEGGQEPPKEEA